MHILHKLIINYSTKKNRILKYQYTYLVAIQNMNLIKILKRWLIKIFVLLNFCNWMETY